MYKCFNTKDSGNKQANHNFVAFDTQVSAAACHSKWCVELVYLIKVSTKSSNLATGQTQLASNHKSNPQDQLFNRNSQLIYYLPLMYDRKKVAIHTNIMHSEDLRGPQHLRVVFQTSKSEKVQVDIVNYTLYNQTEDCLPRKIGGKQSKHL